MDTRSIRRNSNARRYASPTTKSDIHRSGPSIASLAKRPARTRERRDRLRARSSEETVLLVASGLRYDPGTAFQYADQRKSGAKPDAMTDRILRKAILKAEEEYADDGQAEAAQTEAVEEATKRGVPPNEEERRLLALMRDWAQRARHRADSKAGDPRWLEVNLRSGGHGTNVASSFSPSTERPINGFSKSSRRTDMVAIDWHHSRRHGSGRARNGQSRFPDGSQRSPDIRILLATDAASEGIDLQNYCNCLIHVEIP